MFGLPYKTSVKAINYAISMHNGQFRKDDVTHYVIHPLGVADLVSVYAPRNDDYSNLIHAALFHDILEDCDCSEESMREDWGNEITDLVVGLTNTSKTDRPELNRQQRKALDTRRLALQSENVILVKLCDIYWNLGDVESLDRGFARKFVGEKRQQVLTIMPEEKLFCRKWTSGHFQLRVACLQLADKQMEKLNAE